MDLSAAVRRYFGDRWSGYQFYVDGLGLSHVFIDMNPIDAKGFVVDESGSFEIREGLTPDELLNKFAALTMHTYVFEGEDHYEDFRPNPVDNRGETQILTNLLARVHFPDGLTFKSNGSIGLAMEIGPEDRTLRLDFERWSLDGEDIPIYLAQDRMRFLEHPELVRPEFIKLDQPTFIKRS